MEEVKSAPALPSVVIAGRPNVGKSTLFNRLTGTRRSIVTDEAGITRDRIYGMAHWMGRRFEVVDTGGIVPDDKALIPREILRQAKVAIETASLLVLIVDARAGILPLDEELARLLRRTGKPVIVAANKVDSQQQENLTGPLHSLGLPVFPVSAEHGYGLAGALAGQSLEPALERVDRRVQSQVAVVLDVGTIPDREDPCRHVPIIAAPPAARPARSTSTGVLRPASRGGESGRNPRARRG